jgi:hypothetical protein
VPQEPYGLATHPLAVCALHSMSPTPLPVSPAHCGPADQRELPDLSLRALASVIS